MNGSIIQKGVSGETDREVEEMRARRRRAEADGATCGGSRAQ